MRMHSIVTSSREVHQTLNACACQTCTGLESDQNRLILYDSPNHKVCNDIKGQLIPLVT